MTFGGIIRSFLKVFCIVVILLVLCGASILALMIRFNSPPDTRNLNQYKVSSVSQDDSIRIEEDGSLYLEVRNGESADSVGRRLEQAGVIRNFYFWQLLSRIKKEHIKTGSYRMELPLSQTAIHSILISGEQQLISVTIPEGLTLKKTAAILEDAGICNYDEFIAAASSDGILDAYGIPGTTMEGYLFPDTYRFQAPYPPEKVVAVLAGTFFTRLREIFPESETLDSTEFNKRVIIASIVEREYRVDDEADLMAGVFYNRLDIGMALQSCATVEYIITEIQGKPHPGVLYNRDLEIRDPYNTYLRPGLPPGPISSPGRVALNAAFNPRPSDYLYFRLVDANAGRHYFSRNFDEHIRAGSLYVKGR